MSALRRSAGSVIVLLASAVFLLCLAGIIGAWVVKPHTDALGNKVFEAAQDSLVFIDAKLERIGGALKSGQQRVERLSDGVGRLPQQDTLVRSTAASLLTILDDELSEPLSSAREWLDSAHTIALSVSKILEAVASSKHATEHKEAVAVALARQLQGVSEAVVEIRSTLKDVRQRLIEIREDASSVRRLVLLIVARLAQVDQTLANLRGRMEDCRFRVAEIQAQIAAARDNFHWWTMVAAVSAALLLAWLAASQVGMVLRGWSLAASVPHAASDRPRREEVGGREA